MFGGRRHFRELIGQSEEGIASNVLADRLKRLVENGLLSKRNDPAHKQKSIYSLTEASIELVPLFVQMGAWGRPHTVADPALARRAKELEEGGPKKWRALMAQLRASHIGLPSA
jgi:DNA-binding HxlR family transcriptional regulator